MVMRESNAYVVMDYYLEHDNKMGVCVHHDGFVYDNYSLTLQSWGQRTAIEQLLEEEAQMVQQTKSKPFTSEQNEIFEREKQRF